MSEPCVWTEDEDGDGGGAWDTTCLNRFEFIEAGPPENRFEYCPYCGRVLKPLRFVDPDEVDLA